MKKGRQGTRIELLCRPGDAARFEALLLRETSTIGVRRPEGGTIAGQVQQAGGGQHQQRRPDAHVRGARGAVGALGVEGPDAQEHQIGCSELLAIMSLDDLEPFAELGSADPELDADLAAHAVVGTLSDHLWQRSRPSAAAIDHVTDVCLAVATAARPA